MRTDCCSVCDFRFCFNIAVTNAFCLHRTLARAATETELSHRRFVELLAEGLLFPDTVPGLYKRRVQFIDRPVMIRTSKGGSTPPNKKQKKKKNTTPVGLARAIPVNVDWGVPDHTRRRAGTAHEVCMSLARLLLLVLLLVLTAV